MWPWGHLAVGYLLYSLGSHRWGRRPESPAVFLLALGTQFPDLVDKPLAWTFGLLDSGRSLGHSYLVAAIVLAILYAVVVPRVGRSPFVAFAVGYLSHPLADLPFRDLLVGEFAFASYLLWPQVPLPPYDTDPSFLAHILAFELGPAGGVELVLVGLAVARWNQDGRPGWRECRGLAARFVRTPDDATDQHR